MNAIYNYFMNASIQDFVFGILIAAITIRVVLDILFEDSFLGIKIKRNKKSL